MDIVIGGGVDSLFSNNGVMAYNGVDGSLLWKRSSRDELFGSAIFQDLNSDGINDVIISFNFKGAINKFVKFLLQISSKKSILKLILDLNRIS